MPLLIAVCCVYIPIAAASSSASFPSQNRSSVALLASNVFDDGCILAATSNSEREIFF